VYCSVCKKEISRQANTTKATGKHTYGTTSVTKKATTTSDGNLRSTCSVCKKETKNTVIPKISSIKLSATSYTYNGKAKTPTVTVKDSKGNTISSNYYKVTYTNNKLPGSATVKIAFKTCYSGTSTKTFKILPKGTKITAVSATKSKGFTVKWSAQKTYTSGYQVQYATNKSFTSAKTKTLNLSKNSLTVSSLKAKTTYYVRVRTYRTVNGQKYYSAWSTVSKVKTK
jgi:hypothetical protein